LEKSRYKTKMTMPDEKTSQAQETLSWQAILNEVKQHRKELLLGNLAAMLAVVAAVPVPLVLPILVDEVLLNRPGKFIAMVNPWFPQDWHGPLLYIGTALALTLVLRLTAIVLNVWQSRTFTLVAKDVVYGIRSRMLNRLSGIALSQYETLGSGKVTSHFVTDINAIDTFLGVSISGFLVAVLSLSGVAIVLFWMNWELALFILLLNPVVIGFSSRLGKWVKELKKRENAAFEIFQESLAETLDSLAQIRAMNREKHYLTRVVDKAGDIRRHAAAFAWKSEAMNRVSFFVFLSGFDVFRALAMLMVLYSNLTIGEMLAVFGYLWFMMSPVQEIINMQYSWYAANGAMSRINGLLALDSVVDTENGKDPFSGRNTVGLELQDVSFSYGEGETVLDQVSLTVAPGEKVALVGASGGGKSTLVQALLGLYPPSAGEIHYGGVPVREIGWSTVRDNVGVVLQHPILFNASIRDNLAMGREYADDQLWNALAIAQLNVLVENLPEGLDTIVGQHGVRLSGGQRQRLAIARMVLTEPKVVILDEATSALDAETERMLHVALGQFLRGRTTLIIAHRLSAVKQADRILVFENGTVVEEGDHGSLMEKGGLYHKLYAHA
jgi:ATP-binding cassette subfamily C protein